MSILIIFIYFLLFRIFQDSLKCLALRKIASHALTVKETQNNYIEHAGDTCTYNNSELYLILNLQSAFYWHNKKELWSWLGSSLVGGSFY